MKVGNKTFYANEPVIYFDTLKTSSMEGASTTVYAQGGRGNTRLVAWDGERTVTFTMEDALISPESFMILSGAGLIEASESSTIKQHITETFDASSSEVQNTFTGSSGKMTIKLSNVPYQPTGADTSYIYVMLKQGDSIISEPIHPSTTITNATIEILSNGTNGIGGTSLSEKMRTIISNKDFDSVIVDYYTERSGNAMQIDITPESFGGNFYLEASTLFRDTNGADMPAEFIIPNCKIQSNFTFTMASSGDPSSFTFTMDAFPDYTRFDRSKKVLAAIQVITDEDAEDNTKRTSTWAVEADHPEVTSNSTPTVG